MKTDPEIIQKLEQAVNEDVYRVEPEDRNDYYNIIDCSGIPLDDDIFEGLSDEEIDHYNDILYGTIVVKELNNYFS